MLEEHNTKRLVAICLLLFFPCEPIYIISEKSTVLKYIYMINNMHIRTMQIVLFSFIYKNKKKKKVNLASNEVDQGLEFRWLLFSYQTGYFM